MFGFGRRKAIEAEAKVLGDLVLSLVRSINSMSMDEFIEAARRRGFRDSYTDRAERTYGFFVDQGYARDFSFHAIFDDTRRQLVAEGHSRCFGLVISASDPTLGVGVDMKDTIPKHKLGKDALALQAALSRFPGFTNTDDLLAELGYEKPSARRFWLALALSVGLLLPAVAQAADAYVCIADQGVGFSFNEVTKRWDTAVFDVSERKHLFRKATSKWEWVEFGSEKGVSCNGPNDMGFAQCEILGLVNINVQFLRYQISYVGGYVMGVADFKGGDTPFIEIGRCSPL